jgi:hypothetical protein
MLQDAAREGLVELSLHQKAGTWIVDKFGDELKTSKDVTRLVPESVKPVSPAVREIVKPAADGELKVQDEARKTKPVRRATSSSRSRTRSGVKKTKSSVD